MNLEFILAFKLLLVFCCLCLVKNQLLFRALIVKITLFKYVFAANKETSTENSLDNFVRKCD